MKNFLVLIVISLLFISCGDSGNEKSVNSRGGKGRANNYENISFVSDQIELQKFKDAKIGGAIKIPLALDYRSLIVPTTKGYIAKVVNGNISWKKRLPDSTRISSAMAADKNGNIYVFGLNGVVYSFDPAGELRWEYVFSEDPEEFEIYSDLLATGNAVYAGGSNGTLVKLDTEGNEVFKRNSDYALTQTFAATNDGKIILPLTENKFGGNDSLVVLKPDGTEEFSTSFKNFRLTDAVAFRNDHIYFAGIKESSSGKISELYKMDMTGKVVWKKELVVIPKYISISNNDEIYVNGYNSGVGQALSGIYKFGPDGKLTWKLYIETAVETPIMIGENLLAFYGHSPTENAVFFMKKGDGKISRSMTLEDLPIITFAPVVLKNGSIVTVAANELSIIKVVQREETL